MYDLDDILSQDVETSEKHANEKDGQQTPGMHFLFLIEFLCS